MNAFCKRTTCTHDKGTMPMASIDDLNILTNGDFSNGLTGWSVSNPSGNDAPGVFNNSGVVSFNSGNQTGFGDSIQQSFDATVGNTYAVSLDLIENNSGSAAHTFRIELINDEGDVIETVTETVINNSTKIVGFTFTADSSRLTIRITNTTSTSSIASDGKVDNVRVIDVTGNNDLEGTDAGEAILGGPANDAIYAGRGDDTAFGGAGNDEIRGSQGDDLLFGGSGEDLIIAGNEDDIV